MPHKKYHLRFLPSFQQDLIRITTYIAFNLQNPLAADHLITTIERAIYRRRAHPLAFQPYPSKHPHTPPYYRIRVKNYVIFYVVIGNTMEVRRLIYSHRDLDVELLD